MHHKYSHGQVLADLCRRGLIQAAPDVNTCDEDLGQQSAPGQVYATSRNGPSWRSSWVRRHSLPPSPSGNFNVELEHNTGPLNHGLLVGHIDPALDGEADAGSGIPPEPPHRFPFFPTGAHDLLMQIPIESVESQRVSSHVRVTELNSDTLAAQGYDSCPDTRFPSPLPPDTTAQQRSQHALGVLLAQAQVASKSRSLSLASGLSHSKRYSESSRRPMNSPSIHPNLLSTMSTSSGGAKLRKQNRFHHRRVSNGGPRNHESHFSDQSVATLRGGSTDVAMVGNLSVGPTKDKISKLDDSDNLRFAGSISNSSYQGQHHLKRYGGIRPRSPSEAFISRVIRETRPLQRPDLPDDTRRTFEVKDAEISKTDSDVKMGDFVSRGKEDSLTRMRVPREKQHDRDVTARLDGLKVPPSCHTAVSRATSEPSQSIYDHVKNRAPHSSSKRGRSCSQDHSTISNKDSVMHIASKHKHRPASSPTSSDSVGGDRSKSNQWKDRRRAGQFSPNRHERKNITDAADLRFEALRGSNMPNATGPALFEDGMQIFTPTQSSGFQGIYPYHSQTSGNSMRDSLRTVVKKWIPGSKYGGGKDGETASLASSVRSHGGSFSSDFKWGGGIYVSRSFEVAGEAMA